MWRNKVRETGEPHIVTVRTLLSWFGQQRRGRWVVGMVRAALREVDLPPNPISCGSGSFRHEWQRLSCCWRRSRTLFGGFSTARFSMAEVAAARNPADEEREISGVADLTFTAM